MMKKIFRLKAWFVLSALIALPTYAQADAQEKISLIKKVYRQEKFTPYAAPELRKLVKQAQRVAYQIDEDMGCELFENYELGIGNGGKPANSNTFEKKFLKIKVLPENKVRASFADPSVDKNYKVVLDFDISCQNGKCQINDIYNVSDKSSLKKRYADVIRTRSCGY